MVENGKFYASLMVFDCNCSPSTVVGLPTKIAVVYILDLGVTSRAGDLYPKIAAIRWISLQRIANFLLHLA